MAVMGARMEGHCLVFLFLWCVVSFFVCLFVCLFVLWLFLCLFMLVVVFPVCLLSFGRVLFSFCVSFLLLCNLFCFFVCLSVWFPFLCWSFYLFLFQFCTVLKSPVCTLFRRGTPPRVQFFERGDGGGGGGSPRTWAILFSSPSWHVKFKMMCRCL